MPNSDNHARISRDDYPVTRLKLRAWLQLEDVRDKLTEAAEEKNRNRVEMYLYEYISSAVPIAVSELKQVYWYDISLFFREIYSANRPNSEYPLLRPRSKKKEDDIDFDYPGRSWFMWLHTLARNYGWSMEYIAELDINDAIALMQEILYDEQLQREWEWGTTEIAYPYDAATKKSKFHPLQRPEWMQAAKPVKEIKNVRMKKSELPMGIILRWDNGKSTNPQ